MTMQIREASKLPQQGKIVLIYGDTGRGKTTSSFATLPGPILYIMTEPRNPAENILAAGRDPKDIHIVEVGTWDELIEFFSSDLSKFDPYASILLDSMSYLMNVRLSQELEDEGWEARTEEDKAKKPLVSRGKLSLEGFGGLSSQMNRLMFRLSTLSLRGKYVIITCLLAENPKWDRELSAAPLLKGREFPSQIGSYCDLIGLLESRYDNDGNAIYPPIVRFDGEGFVRKFTGVRPSAGAKMVGPLDFQKIFGLKKKQKEKGGKDAVEKNAAENAAEEEDVAESTAEEQEMF